MKSWLDIAESALPEGKSCQQPSFATTSDGSVLGPGYSGLTSKLHIHTYEVSWALLVSSTGFPRLTGFHTYLL